MFGRGMGPFWREGYIGIYNGVWAVPRFQRKEMYEEKTFDRGLWNEFTSSLIPVGIWVGDKN